MDKESESMASSFDSDDDDEEVTLPTEDSEEDE